MRVESLESIVESQKRFIALRSFSGSRPSTLDPRPSGMTLIELLMVIIILTMIVAAAIPLLSPSNDDRRMREAARTLNTYITGAQSRAISLHRPYGVALKRLSHDTKRNKSGDLQNDNGVCLEVFYVEQASPYSGFDVNSRACVALYPNPGLKQIGLALIRFVTHGTANAPSQDSLPVGWDADLFPSGTLRPGDVIEINGTRFELLYDIQSAGNVTLDSNGYYYYGFSNSRIAAKIVARPLNDSGQQINPRYDDDGNEIGSKAPPVTAPYWTHPAPYKVLRQPTPASDPPYQLPEGTAIDLRASGVGIGDYFYVPGVNDNDEGILIMFAPEGRVARVSFSQLPLNTKLEENEVYDQPVVDNVFLLLGRRENIPPIDVKADKTLDKSAIKSAVTDEQRARLRQPLNWMLGTSKWIVIGSQSGRIATIENAFVDFGALYDQYTNAPYKLSPASEELRNQQILAAREYTREMAQTGGR